MFQNPNPNNIAEQGSEKRLWLDRIFKKRYILLILLILLIIILLSSIGFFWWQKRTVDLKIGEELKEKIKTTEPGEKLEVVVFFDPDNMPKDLGKINEMGIDVSSKDLFGAIPGFAIELSPDEINELAKLDYIKMIDLDQEIIGYLNEVGDIVNIQEARTMGITGSEIKICVIDTGIDKEHPALSGRVIEEYNFIDNTPKAPDTHGHGTFVAGIIASNDNNFKGIAPNSLILSAKILDDNRTSKVSQAIKAIDWCVFKGAEVINVSFGTKTYYDNVCDNNVLSQTVNFIVENYDIPVVASAGNAGNKGVGAPACASKSISVGSVNKDKTVPIWSARGERIDLLAPGYQIKSTVPGGHFQTGNSGTSFSASIVSGAIALAMQTKKQATVDDIKDSLYATAIPAQGCYVCAEEHNNLCLYMRKAECKKRDTGFGIVNISGIINNILGKEVEIPSERDRREDNFPERPYDFPFKEEMPSKPELPEYLKYYVDRPDLILPDTETPDTEEPTDEIKDPIIPEEELPEDPIKPEEELPEDPIYAPPGETIYTPPTEQEYQYREQYERESYALNIAIKGNGSVIKTPDREKYIPGEVITIKAVPKGEGSYFSHYEWNERKYYLNPLPITFPLRENKDQTITAVFDERLYTLTLNAIGNGSVSKSPDKDKYVPGEWVVIKAIPNKGSYFRCWVDKNYGHTCTYYGNHRYPDRPQLIIMNRNTTLTAYFQTYPPKIKTPEKPTEEEDPEKPRDPTEEAEKPDDSSDSQGREAWEWGEKQEETSKDNDEIEEIEDPEKPGDPTEESDRETEEKISTQIACSVITVGGFSFGVPCVIKINNVIADHNFIYLPKGEVTVEVFFDPTYRSPHSGKCLGFNYWEVVNIYWPGRDVVRNYYEKNPATVKIESDPYIGAVAKEVECK